MASSVKTDIIVDILLCRYYSTTIIVSLIEVMHEMLYIKIIISWQKKINP